MCKDWVRHLSRDGQTTAVVRVFWSSLLWRNRKQIWHANFMRIKAYTMRTNIQNKQNDD